MNNFTRSLIVSLLLGYALCLVHISGHSNPVYAQAIQRCLSDVDCPKGQPCINRQCFQGIILNPKVKGTRAYYIAISPIRLMGSPSAETNRLAQDIYNQIKNNFDTLVGTFKVLPLRIYLERPPHDGIELGTFRFRPWNQIRANGLIKMAIRQDNQNLRLQFRFYDVDAAQLAVRVDLSIAPKNYRWIIHQLCDRIYQYLTRNKGIFTSKIAYVQRNPSGKGKDIWIADFDGSQRKLVVRNGHLNLMPSWSPDGNSLVFMSFMDGQAYLYRLHLPSARIQRLTFQSGTYSGPVFSTDGKSIAFSMTDEKSRTDSNIYIMQANGSNMRKLTSSWGIDVSPTWSVDSSMLAFVSERFASPQIFVMNANGSNQTRLTFKGDYNQEPRWSPKHNEILFTARDEFLRYDLFVIRIDTNKAGQINTEYRRLTQNQGTNLEATWSPDGRFILFVSTRYGERKLFIMNADGSHQRLFMRGRGDFETPAWSPLLSKDISLRTASKPEPTTSPVTKPSVESDKPKADGDKPKADGDKPKADGDKPKADSDKPKADGDKPKTDSDKPKTDGDKPKADGDKPKTDGDKPKADGDKPKADGDKPKANGDKPKTDGDKPKADGDKPKADGDKPKADGDKPKADGDKPKADGDSTK